MSATPAATPVWNGSLNKQGSPIIKLQIGGLLPNSSQEFEAIVDTGFTGFLAMPMVKAFPLGLILTGTTTVTLADGKSAFKLTALGGASVADRTEIGVILLDETSNDILLGMDFLRQFKFVLFVHPNVPIISLIDESLVNQFLQGLSNAVQQAANLTSSPPGSPPQPTSAQP